MNYMETFNRLTLEQQNAVVPKGQLWLRPNLPQDNLIDSQWQRDGEVVTVLARASDNKGNWNIFLSNGEIWYLPWFFDNYKRY